MQLLSPTRLTPFPSECLQDQTNFKIKELHMEAAGLAIGAAALVRIFEDAVDVFPTSQPQSHSVMTLGAGGAVQFRQPAADGPLHAEPVPGDVAAVGTVHVLSPQSAQLLGEVLKRLLQRVLPAPVDLFLIIPPE
ncbi:hypothetical protein PG984_012500 [Apiospora sp. TS-2023a]